MIDKRKIPFPAVMKISFAKVIESLEKQAKDKDPGISTFAKDLLKETEKHPELRDGFEDPALLKKYKKIIDKLMRIIFPDALTTNEIKGAIPPFEFKPFYMSTRFENILKNADDFTFGPKGYDEDMMYIFGCTAILHIYYNYNVGQGIPTFVDIPNRKLNTVRTYRMALNVDLMEMIPTDKAIDITEEDYQELMDNYTDVKRWKEKFPPGSWIMRGIGITNLMDVTFDRSLSQITSNLLVKTPDAYEKVEKAMRNLMNIQDLQFGFVPFHNDTFFSTHKENMRSILLGDKDAMPCEGNLCDMSRQNLINRKEPLIVTDAEEFDKQSNSTLSHAFNTNGIKSFILAPLINNDELFGFLELASPRKYDLNGSSLERLNEILPILSLAAARLSRESQNLIEAIIQQECTTIHASVKWRFEQEAQNYLSTQYSDGQPVFSDIVFKDVYPLYGQVDIKSSSVKRNEAVKHDLLKQIKGVKSVLSKASKKTRMPVYDEMMHRMSRFIEDIRRGLSSGSEHKILGILNSEVYPVFNQLKDSNDELSKAVDDYMKMLDPELGTVYEKRKEFDDSVNRINQTLASFLDEKQVEAQEMFPHYFERYKTDGLEYNIYIGQSISRARNFDPVYLNNLRLWQLMVMCALERRYRELQHDLPVELEVASLILVYNSSLAVHFRTDEKRFDVEGAYNARYEVVKKRVDKAHIKGTKERITAPGKIAIIYSSDQDAAEYGKYLEYLESRGDLIKGSTEDLELENLQGISGLRALRVAVNYEQDKKKEEVFSVDKILADIRKN